MSRKLWIPGDYYFRNSIYEYAASNDYRYIRKYGYSDNQIIILNIKLEEKDKQLIDEENALNAAMGESPYYYDFDNTRVVFLLDIEDKTSEGKDLFLCIYNAYYGIRPEKEPPSESFGFDPVPPEY